MLWFFTVTAALIVAVSEKTAQAENGTVDDVGNATEDTIPKVWKVGC